VISSNAGTGSGKLISFGMQKICIDIVVRLVTERIQIIHVVSRYCGLKGVICLTSFFF
jgi:hypothetical protein